MMRLRFNLLAILLFLVSSSVSAWADDYTDTIMIFKNAGASSAFFDNSYGYAVFPTIGKGGIGIGGAFGKGRVYKIWRMLAPAREEGLRLRLGTSRYS